MGQFTAETPEQACEWLRVNPHHRAHWRGDNFVIVGDRNTLVIKPEVKSKVRLTSVSWGQTHRLYLGEVFSPEQQEARKAEGLTGTKE